ncbi:epimerase [Microbacterium sp. NPDC091313]
MAERARVVIAGASGYVGSALHRRWANQGALVRTIGRDADARWSEPDAIARELDGADVLVNLAGASVDRRYTRAGRDTIYRSRIDTTAVLRRTLERIASPPPVWLNASTATIYRDATDRAQTERAGELGSGFSVDVARDWEAELFTGELPTVRRVAMRMAIVIGDGPATRMLLALARLGAGGPQLDGPWFRHDRYRGIGPHATVAAAHSPAARSGRQMFSWIHLDDALRAMEMLVERDDMAGPVNLVGPHPVDNPTLMRTLRTVVGAPFGLPAPRWVLEPAMWALRTEPELVLKSRWVAPEKLRDAGFVFRYDDLDQALRAVLRG